MRLNYGFSLLSHPYKIICFFCTYVVISSQVVINFKNLGGNASTFVGHNCACHLGLEEKHFVLRETSQPCLDPPISEWHDG